MLPVTKTAISASLISHTGVNSQATNREKKDGTLELNHESLITRNRAKQGSFASSHAFEYQHGLLACVHAWSSPPKGSRSTRKKGTSPTEQVVCTELRTVALLKVISNSAVHASDAKCIKPHPADEHELAN
jgi:hypothetical protein